MIVPNIALSDQLLMLLQQRCQTVLEYQQWEKLVRSCDYDQCSELFAYFSSELTTLSNEAKNFSLQIYLDRYEQSQADLEVFLQQYKSSHPDLAHHIHAVLSASEATRQTADIVVLAQAYLDGDDALHDALSSLSTVQLQYLIQSIDDDEELFDSDQKQELRDQLLQMQEELFEEELALALSEAQHHQEEDDLQVLQHLKEDISASLSS